MVYALLPTFVLFNVNLGTKQLSNEMEGTSMCLLRAEEGSRATPWPPDYPRKPGHMIRLALGKQRTTLCPWTKPPLLLHLERCNRSSVEHNVTHLGVLFGQLMQHPLGIPNSSPPGHVPPIILPLQRIGALNSRDAVTCIRNYDQSTGIYSQVNTNDVPGTNDKPFTIQIPYQSQTIKSTPKKKQ